MIGRHKNLNIDKQKLIQLYCEAKKTAKEIAEMYGCSTGNIYSWMKSYQIDRRSLSEAVKLRRRNSRFKNPDWEPTKAKREGYIVVYKPDHPNADKSGRIFEHRLVMSQIIGRPLESGEYVHHINGIRDDNRPKNLELISLTNNTLRDRFCKDCPMRKELRLLRWQIKQLQEQVQYKLKEN